MCLLLSVFAISLSSCSDNQDNAGSSKYIVGTWICVSNEGWVKENGKIIEQWNEKEDEDDSLYLVFHSDGTLEYIDPSDDYEVVETGTWKYKNGKIFGSSNGDDYVVDVISVNETYLVVGNHETFVEDGITYEYYEAEHYRKIADAS